MGKLKENRNPEVGTVSGGGSEERADRGRASGATLQLAPKTGSKAKELYRQANAIGLAAQGLNVHQKRLVVLALGEIDYKADEPSLEAIVPLKAFEEHGIENPYDRIIKAAKELPGQVIVIEEASGGFTSLSWAPEVRYVPADESDRGFSYVRVVFNEKLRPWITNFRSHFAVLPLRETLEMPSVLSARLYELLWHQWMAGMRPEFEMDIQDLKFSLGLLELDQRGRVVRERYGNWRDFSKQLDASLKLIREHGSLAATFSGFNPKGGKKFTMVRFVIEVLKPIPHLDIKPTLTMEPGERPDQASNREERVRTELKSMGFQGSIAPLLRRHSIDEIEAAISLTRGKDVDNPGAYVRSLLVNGVAREQAEFADKEQARHEAMNQREVASGQEMQLATAWDEYCHEVVDRILMEEGLDEEQVAALVVEAIPKTARGQGVIHPEDRRYRAYRHRAIFERYPSKVPDAAVDFEAFKKMLAAADETL